jgi:hypothetical protein
MPQDGAGCEFAYSAHPETHIEIRGGGCDALYGPKDKYGVPLFFSETLIPLKTRPVAKPRCIHANVAKAGGLQSPGVKGEAVISYRNPLTTPDLKSSGFPAGLTTWQNRLHPSNAPIVMS